MEHGRSDDIWLARLGHKKDITSTWLILSGHLPLDPTFHVFKKPKPQEKAMCGYSDPQSQLDLQPTVRLNLQSYERRAYRCFQLSDFQNSSCHQHWGTEKDIPAMVVLIPSKGPMKIKKSESSIEGVIFFLLAEFGVIYTLLLNTQ